MGNIIKGTAKNTTEGIKKQFKNYDPQRAIFELVWNGFDAKSEKVDITIREDSISGLEAVEIIDHGEGIDIKRINDTFGKYNDSIKKYDADLHGSQGRGRLTFHLICTEAKWYSKHKNGIACITVSADSIEQWECKEIGEDELPEFMTDITTGTYVVLDRFPVNRNLPLGKNLLNLISVEFSWYLALYPKKELSLDGKSVPVPQHELREKSIAIEGNQFSINVIQWEHKPTSERSFNYLVSSHGKVIDKKLSGSNNKPGFYVSAYVISNWFDDYDPEALPISPEGQTAAQTINQVYGEMEEFQRDLHRVFLQEHVDKVIQDYDNKGYFPEHSDEPPFIAKYRKDHVKNAVRELYLAEPQIFNKLNEKATKIIIGMLDRLLSSESEELLEVLQSVLEMSTEGLRNFAEQLKITSVENIVKTISVLLKREKAVHQLRELFCNRSKEFLETPDLQRIIENNSWLFGPQYTILGAEEDTFTNVATALRKKVNDGGEADLVTEEDIQEGKSVEGVNRQVDLFLARKSTTNDATGQQIYRCVVVEIKHPDKSLNKSHCRQLEDYQEIISKHPAYKSQSLQFELILIGRQISRDDTYIKTQLDGMKIHGEKGLVSKGDRSKCYVKNWFTLLDDFTLSNDYLLERMKSQLESVQGESTEELVNRLQGKTGNNP